MNMSGMELFDNEKWFTAKEICELCGVNFSTWKRFKKNVGGPSMIQRTRQDSTHAIEYSKSVLKQFQAWLMRNQANQGKSMMTTKELAEVLGVDVRTIQNVANRLAINESTFVYSKAGRPSQAFTEEQTILIKQEIQKHHNLSNRQVDSVSTEKEILENARKAMQALDELYKRKCEQLEQENESLKIELDEAKDWYSVKRMEKLNYPCKFPWRPLKEASESLGYPIKKVFDANYSEVNAYHKEVWLAVSAIPLNFE